MVVPTIDTELQLFANNKSVFFERGINVISCSSDFVSQCRDKRKTAILFSNLDIPAPQIFSLDNIHFPAFCKPYDGSCSIGTIRLNSKEELTTSIITNPKNIFMEYSPRNAHGKDFSKYFGRFLYPNSSAYGISIDIYFSKRICGLV